MKKIYIINLYWKIKLKTNKNCTKRSRKKIEIKRIKNKI
jgi:hypothetical protein